VINVNELSCHNLLQYLQAHFLQNFFGRLSLLTSWVHILEDVKINMTDQPARPHGPYRPNPNNFRMHFSTQFFYPPMFPFPGAMPNGNWFPQYPNHSNKHFYSSKKLKRVQKRAQKFKSGLVYKNETSKASDFPDYEMRSEFSSS